MHMCLTSCALELASMTEDTSWYKPPKKWNSWRVCLRCGSKATKIFDLNSGLILCQICEKSYDKPVSKHNVNKITP